MKCGQQLIGREIHMEISFALEDLEPRRAREMILGHPEGYVLFGSDSPWTDQAQTLALLEKLQLPEESLSRILAGNALRLLDLDGRPDPGRRRMLRRSYTKSYGVRGGRSYNVSAQNREKLALHGSHAASNKFYMIVREGTLFLY